MQEAGDNGSGRLDSWVFDKSSKIDDGCIVGVGTYLHKFLKMIILMTTRADARCMVQVSPRLAPLPLAASQARAQEGGRGGPRGQHGG